MPKFWVTCEEKRIYIVTYEVEAKDSSLARDAVVSDGQGKEVKDEFESTEERTHCLTEEIFPVHPIQPFRPIVGGYCDSFQSGPSS